MYIIMYIHEQTKQLLLLKKNQNDKHNIDYISLILMTNW